MSRIIIITLTFGLIASTRAVQAAEKDESFFIKLPITSLHFGDTGGYKFNQQNTGIGIGYRYEKNMPEVGRTNFAYSLTGFYDSYSCEAINLQMRALKKYGAIALGISGNLVHKCRRPYAQAETFFAPLFSATWNPTKSIRIALDGLPPVSKKYGVGFLCISLDVGF